MYLDVPFVTQLNFGGRKVLMDPTGCWYASACMVGYSFEAGPRLGIPQLYSRPITNADGSAGTGHWAMELGWLDTFMKNEHLRRFGADLPKTTDAVAKELKRCGPLLVQWWKTNAAGQSYGHASVLIGAEGDSIILHDPENAPNSRIRLAEFYPKWEHMAGDKRQWWPVLRRDGPDYDYMVAVKA